MLDNDKTITMIMPKNKGMIKTIVIQIFCDMKIAHNIKTTLKIAMQTQSKMVRILLKLNRSMIVG